MAIALAAMEHASSKSARAGSSRTPGAEINLSSIPVAGDIGGLLFVIGAIVTVLLGLPDIRWFVLGSVVVGAVLAGGLFVWRSSHAGGADAGQFDSSTIESGGSEAPPLLADAASLRSWKCCAAAIYNAPCSWSSNRSAPAAIGTSGISSAIAPPDARS